MCPGVLLCGLWVCGTRVGWYSRVIWGIKLDLGADCVYVGLSGRERGLVINRLRTDDSFISFIPMVLEGKRRFVCGICGVLERYPSSFVGVLERLLHFIYKDVGASLYLICINGSTFH